MKEVKKQSSNSTLDSPQIPPNDEYDLVLIFTKSITESQLDFVETTLRQHHFTTTKAKNNSDRTLLFVRLTDAKVLLQQAEELHIYKMHHHEHKPMLLKQVLNDKLVNALNRVDRRILVHEQMRRFTVKDRSAFLKPEQRAIPGDDHERCLQLFTAAEKLRMVHSYLYKVRIMDIHMISYLRKEGFLRYIKALHGRDPIDTTTAGIEQYFGSNVSVYFEFMSYYQRMLMIPAFIALLIVFYEYYYHESEIVDHGHKLSNAAFVYSVCIMVWTTLFILKWRRCESELRVQWAVFHESHSNRALDRNFYFKGSSRLKLTTGLITEKYSRNKRILQYVFSAFEALPMLLLAGVIKLVIFNINGLIKRTDSIMYIPRFAALNQPGGILYHIPYISTVLDFLTIATIFKINLSYTKLSVRSTKRENHKTTIEFNNSVITKRFIFELINRFMHLWYIAFIEFDIVTLKSLLGKLFIIDEIRKVLTESVLPLVMKRKLEGSGERNGIAERLVELNLWEYDDFDDYIEVIFQYGYIILFAAVFPLAAPLSFFFNWIEIYSDRFKLGQKLYQRSLPSRVNGIGRWLSVLATLSVISIYSNMTFLIFSYYDMFEKCNFSLTQHEHCHWEKLIIVMFIFEHLVLGLKYIMAKYIKVHPRWVSILHRRMKLKGAI